MHGRIPLLLQVFMSLAITADAVVSSDWVSGAPRAEIAPTFTRNLTGGRSGGESLTITCDQRQGLQGYWIKSEPVVGKTFVKFTTYYQARGVEVPRRSVLVRLLWAGADNTDVRPLINITRRDAPSVLPKSIELYGGSPDGGMPAMDELPVVGATGPDGWTEVSGIYRVPHDANRVAIELNLQFAPNSSVVWSDTTLTTVPEPKPRKARIAAVNFEPNGGDNPMDNCRMAEPFVAEAARQGADLVTFSEHYTTQGLGQPDAHVTSAEAIPGGPICAFFGALARKHSIYIVVGMYERDGIRVYNDAVMFGPDGNVAGKYRKNAPTSGEMAKGIMPGDDLPVFTTRFGKVGLLVCYDLQFPELARELGKRGAEMIIAPSYGFPTLLGKSEAMENQIFLVTSIYVDDGKSDPLSRWGITGIIDPEGNVVARAPNHHSIAIADIDLTPRHWVWLGNLRDRLYNHRPVINGTK